MVTLTVPIDPAGALAVTWVADTTLNEVAAVAPNLTVVAPVRLVPVRVTEVPPDTGPAAGLAAVTDGAAT